MLIYSLKLLGMFLLTYLFEWDAEKVTLDEFCNLFAFLLLTSQGVVLKLAMKRVIQLGIERMA